MAAKQQLVQLESILPYHPSIPSFEELAVDSVPTVYKRPNCKVHNFVLLNINTHLFVVVVALVVAYLVCPALEEVLQDL